VLTVPAHGLVSGWRVAVTAVRGMTEINAEHHPPWEADYRRVRVIGPDAIELNEINASDYRPYKGGGVVQYNSPADLDGYSARMVLRAPGGEELYSLTVESGEIVIDDAARTITVTLSAETTAAFVWPKALYELELTSSEGAVYSLFQGEAVMRESVATPASADGAYQGPQHPIQVWTPSVSALMAITRDSATVTRAVAGDGRVAFASVSAEGAIAGETLSALLAVWMSGDGRVRRLDAHDAAHIDLFAGVTLTAALEGEDLRVQHSGEIDVSGLLLSSGPVWLGAAGALTQSPPRDGFCLRLGAATSASRFLLSPSQPLRLE
jgi:hypothetical protein